MRLALALPMLACLATSSLAHAGTKLAVLPTQFDESSAGKVPKLFDDYLLTAVQNAGDFEVIGQDDITAMLGFEKQKDLLGCDDMSCIADIGGALGVDRLVVVKIARLQSEWISTAKLINIRDAKVEARSSDFVSGEVRELLRAVPTIVQKLFAGGGDAVPGLPPSATSATPSPVTNPPVGVTSTPNRSIGLGARVSGGIVAGLGLAFTTLGVIYALGNTTETVCDPDCHDETDRAGLAVASYLYTSGVVVEGVGSGIYMNGKARGATGDPEASGRHPLSWLGWVLMPIGALGPLVFSDVSPALAWSTGVVGTLGATWIFTSRMWSSSTFAVTSSGARVPIASISTVRAPGGKRTPLFGLTLEL